MPMMALFAMPRTMALLEEEPGITVVPDADSVLVNGLIRFTVTAPGAEWYQVQILDSNGNETYSGWYDLDTETGTGSFGIYFDEIDTRTVIVETEIDGKTCNASTSVTVTSATGETFSGTTTIHAASTGKAREDFPVSWDAVPNADRYLLTWTNPYGTYWRARTDGTQYTINKNWIDVMGDYTLTVQAYREGYTTEGQGEKAVTFDSESVDERVTLTVTPTEVEFGGAISISISTTASSVERFALYSFSTNESYSFEGDSVSGETIYACQDLELAAGAWMGDKEEWTSLGNTVHVTVTPPQVSVPTEVKAGEGFTVTVSNASLFDGSCIVDGDTRIWYNESKKGFAIPGGVMTPGEHTLEIELYGSYPSFGSYSRTYTVTAAGEQPGAPAVTVDQTEVPVGGSATFTIVAPGADRLSLKRTNWETYDFPANASGTTQSQEYFDSYDEGEVSVSYAARVDGVWSPYSEPIIITVTSQGTLADPTPVIGGPVKAGQDFTVSWDAVEGAEEYRAVLSRYSDEGSSISYVTQEDVVAPATSATFSGSSIQPGNYKITVFSAADGWSEGSGYADFTVEEGDCDFTYSIEDGGAVITGYVGSATQVEIPAELDGYPVTVINYDAFAARSVTEVTLPGTLQKIRSNAFRNCRSLQKIEIAAEVEVDLYAFQNCSSLTVYGYTGSSAETAADKAGCTFVSIGELADGPSFTMDKSQVPTSGIVTMTISAEGATRFKPYVNGNAWSEFEANADGTAEYTTSFGGAGSYSICFTALIDGVWTKKGPAQTLTVTSMGALAQTTITAPESIAAGDELTVSWTPVENAKEYFVCIATADDDYMVFDRWCDAGDTSVTIEKGTLSQGEYTIEIRAAATGWLESSAKKSLSVSAPAEGQEFAYTLLSDGTVMTTKYLGAASGSVTVPTQIDGYAVSAVGNGTFTRGNCPAQVTIPDGVALNSYAFNNVDTLTDLYMPRNPGTIEGYSIHGNNSVTMHVYKNTAAHVYAMANDISFVLYDDGETTDSGITVTLEGESPFFVEQRITVTVTAPEGATQLRVYEDGVMRSYTIELSGSTYSYSTSYYMYGEDAKTEKHYIQFSAYVDGAWTTLSDPVEVEVVKYGKLASPEITLPETVYAAQPLEVSWTPVENAEAYVVSLYSNKEEYSQLWVAGTTVTEGTTYTFTKYDMKRAGAYELNVRAKATGYSSSENNRVSFDAVSSGDWFIENKGNAEAWVYSYTGTSTEAVIPDTYDGAPVTRILYKAFDTSNVTSVTLGQNVRYIDSGAFSSCPQLTKVIIPASVDTIDSYAFQNCPNLTIYGYASTKAQTYAQEKGIPFVLLENPVEPPAFTLDRTQILLNESVKVTVSGAQADMIRVYVGDTQVAEQAVTDGAAEVEIGSWRLSEAGEYSISVSGRVDGVWSGKSKPQTITVSVAGVLSAPVIQPIGTQIPRTAFTIYWTPVENATWYDLVISDENGNRITSYYWTEGFIENGLCYCPIANDTITGRGTYSVVVTAGARVGYERVEYEAVQFTAESESDWLYTEGEDGVTITGYIGSETQVTVPAQINGKNVVAIGESAFANAGAIVSVTLPDTVATIGQGAFQRCLKLESINFPEGLTTIGAEAFFFCNALTAVSLPDSVSTIGEDAFAYCDALTSLTLPQSLGQEKLDAFRYCRNLSSVVIPQGVTEVAGFSGCAKLASVTMPESVTRLGAYAFMDCSALTDASFVSQMTYIDYGAFSGCTGITEVSLNTAVTHLYGNTFSDCTALTKATVLANVETIDDSAFSGCTALIIWGDEGSAAQAYADAHSIPFKVIGEVDRPMFTMESARIFYDETAVFHVSAPEAKKVRLYIDGAQYDEYTLTDGAVDVERKFAKQAATYQISFAAGYANGTWSAPCTAKELEVVYYGPLAAPTIETIGTIDSERILAEEAFVWSEDAHASGYEVWFDVQSNDEWTSFCAMGTLSETEIAFKDIDWNDGHYRIRIVAQTDERGYESSAVASQEFDVRLDQLSAPEVTMAASVLLHETVSATWEPVAYATAYHVTLADPEGNKVIDEITTETGITYDTDDDTTDGAYTLCVQASAPWYLDSKETEKTCSVVCYGTLAEPVITLPSEVVTGSTLTMTWVADERATDCAYAYTLCGYSGSSKTNSVTIDLPADKALGEYPATVKAQAKGYRSSESSATVQVVGVFAYEIVNGKAVITRYRGSDSAVTVPDTIDGYSVVEIGADAFAGNTTITSVELPDSVTRLSDRAFKDCTELIRVVGHGVTSLGEEVFSGCTKLTYVDFSESLTEIGAGAFTGTNVEYAGAGLDITLGEDAQLSEGYYEDNALIESVTYPEGMTEIPARTHYHNVNLREVNLPTTMKIIGSKAFAQCGKLSTVVLYDGIESIADDAFSGSSQTRFLIYVRNLTNVSYVEQYAIDHAIPYQKILYGAAADMGMTVEGEGLVSETETEYTVRVDRPVTVRVTGDAADTAEVYLDGVLIHTDVFTSGAQSFTHTFTELGDFHLYGYSYVDDAVLHTTLDKTVHVVGTTFSMDKEEAWTCESVRFEVTSSQKTGTALLYVDGELFAQAELVDGRASVDYGFRKAGDRRIQVVVDDQSSIERTITIKSIDKLAQPVVEAALVQLLSQGLTLSWAAVEHAQGYVVRAINAQDKIFLTQEVAAGEDERLVCTLAQEQLQGAGTYAVFVMAYGYQYDQSQSDSAIVQMADGPLCFTVDKTQVTTGEDVTFTVTAPGATQAQMIVDDETILTLDMENGALTFARPFTRSGERSVTFRALIDSVWTEPCEAQIVTVSSIGALGKPQVQLPAYCVQGNDVAASWAAVEHADGYRVRVYGSEGAQVLYEAETQQTGITIPAQTFATLGVYTVDVMAYGAGYDQSEGSADTEIVDCLPAPMILTPQEGAAVEATSVEVTWSAVDGALGYVMKLERRKEGADGATVYESVFETPNEIVNVGTALSYTLTGLAYGDEYRVSVGTVTEGTGIEANAKVRWSTRSFSVTLPTLQVTLSANPNPAYEKSKSVITVSVSHADTVAVITDASGAVYVPVRNVATDTGRELDFEVTESRQGTYTYTATVKGTGALEKATPVEKTIEITYLDANAPAVVGVEMTPETIWEHMEETFTVRCNEHTESVDVYMQEGGKDVFVAQISLYDTLFPTGEREFTYTRRFDQEGSYALHFTPVNEDGDWSEGYPVTLKVLPEGKVPDPVFANLSDGDILLEAGFTARWNSVQVAPGMSFGGYTVILCEKDSNGAYQVVPGYAYVNTGMSTQFTLPALTAGKEYQLEVYTLNKAGELPEQSKRGYACVRFGYRTVPEFAVTGIEADGNLGSPVTVSWTAPAWNRNAAQKPSRYIVWWYGPGLGEG